MLIILLLWIDELANVDFLCRYACDIVYKNRSICSHFGLKGLS